MLSGEEPNTNIIVFGLTGLWLELTIYRTQGEHANHYTTDAVVKDRRYICVLIVTFVITGTVSTEKRYRSCICHENLTKSRHA